MAEAVQCPYYSGGTRCNISGCSQSQGQIDYYCVTEKSKENWQRCANYDKANEVTRIEKRVR